MASPTAAAQAAGGGADIKTWAAIYSEPVAEWVMQGDLAEELGHADVLIHESFNTTDQLVRLSGYDRKMASRVGG